MYTPLLLTCFICTFALPDDEGCIKISECPAALGHIKNVNKNYNSSIILRNAQCGFIGIEPVVRCDDIPQFKPVDLNECIPLQECPRALQLIKNQFFNPQVVNILRSTYCGEGKLQPLIYCHRISF